MATSDFKPLIGVPANLNRDNARLSPQHVVGGKYMQAIMDGAKATPVIVPAFGEELDIDTLLSALDGVLLTGGRANVQPHHYEGPPFPDDEIIDPARDATVLPLVRACIDRGIPIFGICRGIQEINVALGGSLHYRVHLLEDKMDHRMRRDTEDMNLRFAPRHTITIQEGGYLSTLVKDRTVMVNTLHGQAIKEPAPGLAIEALAEDGIIEAVSCPDAKTFTVGVQWHAEWKIEDHHLSSRLFEAFGAAARTARLRRGKERVA